MGNRMGIGFLFVIAVQMLFIGVQIYFNKKVMKEVAHDQEILSELQIEYERFQASALKCIQQMESFDERVRTTQDSLLHQVDAIRTNLVTELSIVRDTTVAAVSQQFAKEKEVLDARIAENTKQMADFEETLETAQASLLQQVDVIRENFVVDVKSITCDVKNSLIADISAAKEQVIKMSNDEINGARSWLCENSIPDTYGKIASQFTSLQEKFESINDPTARILLNVRLEQLSYLLTEIDKRSVENAELENRFGNVHRMIGKCQMVLEGVVEQGTYLLKKEKFEEWFKDLDEITRELTLLEEDVLVNPELEKMEREVEEMYERAISSLVKAYKLDVEVKLKENELDLYAPKYPHVFLVKPVEDGFLTKLIKEGGWLYQHAQSALDENALSEYGKQLEKIVALRKNVYTSAILGEVEYCKHKIVNDRENDRESKEVYKNCYKMLSSIIVSPDDTYFSVSDTFEMYKQELCRDIQKGEWKWVDTLNMARKEISELTSGGAPRMISIGQY